MGRIVNEIEETAIAILLATMVLITFSQVIARYVFNSGAVWALELTVYCFAWLVLFGMSYGVKTGAHLGVDAFVKLFPAKGQRVLVILSALCCIAYGVILLMGAWTYWHKIYSIGIPTEDLYLPESWTPWWNETFGTDLEDLAVPRWIPYAILPIGLALLIFRFVQATWHIIQGKRQGMTVSHEAEDMVHEYEEHEAQARST